MWYLHAPLAQVPASQDFWLWGSVIEEHEGRIMVKDEASDDRKANMHRMTNNLMLPPNEIGTERI
jgi:hypothetical protein